MIILIMTLFFLDYRGNVFIVENVGIVETYEEGNKFQP